MAHDWYINILTRFPGSLKKKLIYLVLFSLYLGLKFEIRERNLELFWASFGSGRILLIYFFFNLINNKWTKENIAESDRYSVGHLHRFPTIFICLFSFATHTHIQTQRNYKNDTKLRKEEKKYSRINWRLHVAYELGKLSLKRKIAIDNF